MLSQRPQERKALASSPIELSCLPVLVCEVSRPSIVSEKVGGQVGIEEVAAERAYRGRACYPCCRKMQSRVEDVDDREGQSIAWKDWREADDEPL